MIEKIRDLWAHASWADARIFEALPETGPTAGESAREFGHVIGAEEIWLSRLEGRKSRAAVWPQLSIAELEKLMATTQDSYAAYLGQIKEPDLAIQVDYTNSAGQKFSDRVGDILMHVALHGQYHRGKINLQLRRDGLDPAPTDYIAFVRGAPAATEATSLANPSRTE